MNTQEEQLIDLEILKDHICSDLDRYLEENKELLDKLKKTAENYEKNNSKDI